MAVFVEEKPSKIPDLCLEGAGSPPRRRNGIGGGLYDRSDDGESGDLNFEPPYNLAELLEAPTFLEYVRPSTPEETQDVVIGNTRLSLFRKVF